MHDRPATDLVCATCRVTECVVAPPAQAVATMRAFFVRHADCRTVVDVRDARAPQRRSA